MKLSAAEYFQNSSPVKSESKHGKSGNYSKTRSGRCHCCPYGYHIDLDFVRYCQALYQGAKNDSPSLIELKRKKKARRRETRSVEAMLGVSSLDETKSLVHKKDRMHNNYYLTPETSLSARVSQRSRKCTPPSPPPRKQSLIYNTLRSPPPPDLINSSAISERSEAASEALQEAVQDFEDILESSKVHPGRKSRLDSTQSHHSIDLLHHTSHRSPFDFVQGYNAKTNGYSIGRSNSLPRHADSTSFSCSPYWNQKELVSISQRHPPYSYSNKNPFIMDYTTPVSPSHGAYDDETQDIEAMSVSSMMSGVSTTTLQSIRDQMATGLSRLKELEEEVKNFPNILVKMDILREEKRILLEELCSSQQGMEISPVVSLCIEKDQDFNVPRSDLELRLETLRKFSLRKGKRGLERKRSFSPMRVNLQEFKSYRRARRNSLSDSSDSEAPSYLYKNQEKSLCTNESYSDYSTENSYSHRRSFKRHSPSKYSKDVAVDCKASTHSVGVSISMPECRSVGTSTENLEEGVTREIKESIVKDTCLQCLNNRQKTFESRSVGSDQNEIDSIRSSFSLLSIDSMDKVEMDPSTDESGPNERPFSVDQSAIANTLPAVETVDISTNTESCLKRNQFINTFLKMDDLFTIEQLNDLIAEAKLEWESTHKSTLIQSHKFTYNKGTQTSNSASTHTVGVLVKPSYKDVGVNPIPFHNNESSDSKLVKRKSVGVGNCKLSDDICSDCLRRRSIYYRTVGSGHCRIDDILCEKCTSKNHRNVGVGDSKISDELCLKCKVKKNSSYCQTMNSSKSVTIQTESLASDTSLSSAFTDQECLPSGSSGVQVCDKCHEAITSVAKDMVFVSTPTVAAYNISDHSKIPRRVEPSATVEGSGPVHLRAESGSTQANSLLSKSSVDRKPAVEAKSKTSVPYMRQQTYSKGDKLGHVNPAFEGGSQHSFAHPSESTLKTTKSEITGVAKSNNKMKSATSEPLGNDKFESKTQFSASSSDTEETGDVSSVAESSTLATNVTSSSASVVGGIKKKRPSRGMRAALKVLNDSVGKPVRSSQQLTNAINIIQKEWFKISSVKDSDPIVVEEYMDVFEEYSRGVLQRVVNLADVNGNTAMHYAVSHGSFDIVSVLLDSKVCCLNLQNKAGYTAVMLVALAEIINTAHESVVKKLFDYGDVNIKASQHGQTALMLAVSHGRFDMVRMLVAAGANPNIQDEDGSTALMCAAEHGHLAIVRFLMAQPDTDLYLMDNDGSTALTIAVEAGHKDVGVVLYKQMNLSRGPSPRTSLRGMKRSQIPLASHSSSTLPPRSSAPASPGFSRKSSGRVSPASDRNCSASLSNLIL